MTHQEWSGQLPKDNAVIQEVPGEVQPQGDHYLTDLQQELVIVCRPVTAPKPAVPKTPWMIRITSLGLAFLLCDGRSTFSDFCCSLDGPRGFLVVHWCVSVESGATAVGLPATGLCSGWRAANVSTHAPTVGGDAVPGGN